MSVKENLCGLKSILRFVELIFSIITFAVIAQYDGWDKVNYTLFVGITTMIICLVYIGVYAMGGGDSPTVTLVELVIDILWWIFWLSCAAVLSNIVATYNSSVVWFDYARFQASCAFAWMTFFLWTATTAMTMMSLMKGRRSSGPPVPEVPQGGVAMV